MTGKDIVPSWHVLGEATRGKIQRVAKRDVSNGGGSMAKENGPQAWGDGSRQRRPVVRAWVGKGGWGKGGGDNIEDKLAAALSKDTTRAWSLR